MRKIIVLAGPTAVGKTEYAIDIALEFGGEIVSCDSMQIYKYMDIGSAKPTAEERQKARHHLVDLVDPSSPLSAAAYQKLAKSVIEDIFSRKKVPVIAGGTGLYLHSLLYDMDFGPDAKDPELRKELEEFAKDYGSKALHDRLYALVPASASRIHPNNIKRVIRAIEAAESGDRLDDFADINKKTTDYDAVLIGLERDRAELYERIDKRVIMLMEQGLAKEVEKLVEMGYGADDIAMKGIGYKELIPYLEGIYLMDEAVSLIKRNTRHYAKRQMTWFRRYDEMKWFNLSHYESKDDALEDICTWLKRKL